MTVDNNGGGDGEDRTTSLGDRTEREGPVTIRVTDLQSLMAADAATPDTGFVSPDITHNAHCFLLRTQLNASLVETFEPAVAAGFFQAIEAETGKLLREWFEDDFPKERLPVELERLGVRQPKKGAPVLTDPQRWQIEMAMADHGKCRKIGGRAMALAISMGLDDDALRLVEDIAHVRFMIGAGQAAEGFDWDTGIAEAIMLDGKTPGTRQE